MWAARIGFDLFIDVAQRRRQAHAFGHGEAEPLSLSGLVVGVLSDEHHLDPFERAEMEGPENMVGRGIAGVGGIFLNDERVQRLEVGPAHLVVEHLRPVGGKLEKGSR